MFALPSLKPDEVLIYLRKSRTDDPSLSIEEVLALHEQRLDEFAQQTWGELVPECNRFREVVSGETIAARPEVQKVLRLIEQPRFRAVLVFDPQRLSRGDLEDIGRIVKTFRYTGTLLLTPRGAFDLADERDRDYLERELMRGNDYLEYTRKIMQNGLRACVERGWYVGSQPPYGYRKVSVKEGRRSVHTLEPVPAEAEAVLLMFRMYAAGSGAASICQALNSAGVPPRAAEIWRPPVIYRILDNPHYLGLVRYDHRKQERVIVDGELKKQRAVRKDAPLYPGKHPAIVPQELWDAVQRARAARHLPPVRSHLDIQNPLAGIMYCACGSVMVKAAQTKGRGVRIHCKDQARCGNAGCTIDVLLREIAAALRAELEDFVVCAARDDDAETAGRQARLLQSRVDALQAKRDGLWGLLAEGMPRDVFDRLLAKNEQELAAASHALSEALDAADRAEGAEAAEASLYAALGALESKDAPVKEINVLLRAVIRRITYRRERAYRGEDGRVVRPDPVLQIELRV